MNHIIDDKFLTYKDRVYIEKTLNNENYCMVHKFEEILKGTMSQKLTFDTEIGH